MLFLLTEIEGNQAFEEDAEELGVLLQLESLMMDFELVRTFHHPIRIQHLETSALEEVEEQVVLP
jgi:hypothetical protein